jgi:hypothetical protein
MANGWWILVVAFCKAKRLSFTVYPELQSKYDQFFVGGLGNPPYFPNSSPALIATRGYYLPFTFQGINFIHACCKMK